MGGVNSRRRQKRENGVILNREELLSALEKHVRLLRKSCRDFDEGDEDEALRIATELRLLLVNGSALLGRLGIVHRLRFTDSRVPIPRSPGTLDLGLLVIELSGDGASPRLRAPLGASGTPANPVKFTQWWRSAKPIAGSADHYSREFLVREMASTEAVHIDNVLDAEYRALTSEKYFPRVQVNSAAGPTPIVGDVATQTLRQIAWELLDTIDRQPLAVWGALEPSP
jgi:hypothetical protein